MSSRYVLRTAYSANSPGNYRDRKRSDKINAGKSRQSLYVWYGNNPEQSYAANQAIYSDVCEDQMLYGTSSSWKNSNSKSKFRSKPKNNRRRKRKSHGVKVSYGGYSAEYSKNIASQLLEDIDAKEMATTADDY